MALFDKIIGSTPPTAASKPERMTSSSLYKSALSEPSKTQTYNPRRAEMDLYKERDLTTLKPAIEDLFEKLGQAIAGTPLASKLNQLNTLRDQMMKLIDAELKK